MVGVMLMMLIAMMGICTLVIASLVVSQTREIKAGNDLAAMVLDELTQYHQRR